MGDFKRAIEYQERSLQVLQEVGYKVEEGKSYCSLGNAYHNLGDFKTAIDYHERDLKIAREVEDKAAEGRACCNLGNVYHSLGDFKRAIEYHERHSNIAKEVGEKAEEGRRYGNLGNDYYSLGNFSTAIEYHERHLKMAKDLGDKGGERNACCNLGNAYDGLEDFKRAIECYERHLKLSQEMKDKAGEGTSYGNLGSMFYSLGDFQKAIEFHECHLKIARQVADKAGIARSLYSLGISFEGQGSLSRSLECYHSSVMMYNDIRASLKFKDEWKISYRDTLEFAYTSLWRLHLKQGEVVEALRFADQGRAQALRDLMDSKYVFGEEYYQSHSPEMSACYPPSCVPSNTVFIAVDGKEIFFWVVQDGKDVQSRRKEITDVSNEDVKRFIISLNESIGTRGDVVCENRSLDEPCGEQLADERAPGKGFHAVHSQRRALRTLYDVIIAPIADLCEGNDIIFVPEGPLCLVPYAALLDCKEKYTCEFFRIRLIPSLATLKLITDCPGDFHKKTGALLVGDPCLQEVPRYLRKGLHQLPYAKREVEMIGRILNTAPLTGEKATKDEVLKRLSSVALVHIAAHGRMETGEILLAPSPSTRVREVKDCLLTMTDVLQANLRAKLVVLSCCHSAQGEIKAEGVVGIARAFLGAGARSVLVSLWAIDDEATMEFMKHFYGELVKAKKASVALHEAMKCIRESQQFGEVNYWAPFVLIGDDVTLESVLD